MNIFYKNNRENFWSLLLFSMLFLIFFYQVDYFLFHSNLNDVFHNTWTYNRNLQNILSLKNPLTPNILFPDIKSSYYSEVSLGDSIIYGLVFLPTGNDVAGYAFLYFISNVLSAFFAFKLARFFNASFLLSIASGIVTGFFSYRYFQFSHVQLLSIFWLLAPLFFSFRYLETGKKSNLLPLFLLFVLASDGPSYDFVTLIIVALVAMVTLFSMMKDCIARKRFMMISFLALLAMLVNSWIWVGYFDLFMDGHSRVAHEFSVFKNDLIYFFNPRSMSYADILPSYMKSQRNYRFFSGFIALFFILSSFGIFIRRKQFFETISGNKSYFLKALFFSSCILFLISLGERITLLGLQLFPNYFFIVLTKTPLLGATRFIAHYAYPAISLLSIVSAVRLTRTSLFSGNKSLRIGLIFVLFMLIEMYPNDPEHSSHRSFPKSPLYDFLGTLRQGAGAIYLPFSRKADDISFTRQFEYMRYAHSHSLWIVNGISGFYPHEYRKATKSFTRFPSFKSYAWIARNNLTYIILDKRSPEYINDIEYDNIRKCNFFIPLYQGREFEVFEIKNPSLIINECGSDMVEPIELGKIYNLRSGSLYDHSIQIMTGWSEPEDWGIWTERPKAQILVFVPADTRAKGYSLYFKAQAFGKQGERKKVGVLVNDKFITDIYFTARHKQEEMKIKIPPSIIQNREIRIEFLIYNPESPADLGLSSDLRKLGIGLISFGVF